MADNVTANPGVGGDTLAADDIGGVKWARVKIGHGADGAATDVSTASPMPVQVLPTVAGGLTKYRLVSAASANATNVKNGAGKLHVIVATNTAATAAYLKLYNSASTPTAGAGTIVWAFAIPGATTGGGVVLNTEQGLDFDTGIGFTLVTGAADNSSTGVGASEILLNLGYK